MESLLARLRDEFVANLSQRLNLLEAQLLAVTQGEHEAVDNLHREAHSLVGTAGIHGLLALSEAARVLEQLAAALPRDEAVAADQLQPLRAALTSLVAMGTEITTASKPSEPA